jgi:hypothetical protein
VFIFSMGIFLDVYDNGVVPLNPFPTEDSQKAAEGNDQTLSLTRDV